MPVPYLRRLTGSNRNRTANRQPAHFLAFIAGATICASEGSGPCNAVGSGSYRLTLVVLLEIHACVHAGDLIAVAVKHERRDVVRQKA